MPNDRIQADWDDEVEVVGPDQADADTNADDRTIVLARDGAIVGVGAGQMNRVQSARLDVEQAGEKARGAI